MVTSVIKLCLVSCMMTCTTYGNFMIVDHHYSILHVPLGINLSRSRLDCQTAFFSILEIVWALMYFIICNLVWGCAFKQYCSHAAGLRYFPVLADRHC